MSTPLPRAQPVRLEHHGEFAAPHIGERLIVVVGIPHRRRGDAVLFHQLFGKRLARLDLRGGLVGPEHAVPAPFQLVRKAERQRVVGGDDGIFDVRMWRLPSRRPPSRRNNRPSTHSASSAMPALPFMQYILSTSGLLASAWTIACSLPAFPITKTFILTSFLSFRSIYVRHSTSHIEKNKSARTIKRALLLLINDGTGACP